MTEEKNTTIRYVVVTTARYRRDERRIRRSGRYDMRKLDAVLNLLRYGKYLPERCRNHKLKGSLEGCEECHIAPDWLLVYQKRKEALILLLVQTGPHTDLSGG